MKNCRINNFANKYKSHILKTIAFLFILLLLLQPVFSEEVKKEVSENTEELQERKTVITIVNALKTSNKKDPVTNDDVIAFEGEVQIQVAQGDTTTVIKADKIIYNRARDMLYAEGSVALEQTQKGGTKENATADSLIFNTITLEGVFDNGKVIQAQSDSLNLPSGSTLVVASDLFARDDSGTIAFKSGELTFCNDDNPHWKIKASRIWLLPGQEFAFVNALLYVGNVPLLYLPAFYYPKDELIFNPVFGYRNRAGYYFQTTTYLYGRKPLDTSNSEDSDSDILGDYFSLIKPTKLKEQELQGLVLHNLDDDYTGDTTNYLKLMADYYSNLGFSLGIDGVYKPKKIFSTLEANLVLGWSHTVFPINSNSTVAYTPYSSTGVKYSDASNFMGMKMPFRYKAGIKIGVTTPFTLTFNVPIFSDPFFNYDFSSREETMDWFSYLLNNPSSEKTETTEAEKLSAAEITSFTWDATGSYNAILPDFMKPYLSSFSVSSFNSSIVFTGLSNTITGHTDNWATYTPERKFFYPSQITPVSISLKIAGTIFDTSKTKKSNTTNTKSIDKIQPPQELKKDVEESSVKNNTTSEEIEEQSTENTLSKGFFLDKVELPELTFSNPTIQEIETFKFNVTYNISPSFSSQISYSSTGLTKPESFDFNRLKSSYILLKVPVELADNISIKNSFLSMTNSVTFNPVYQNHPYLSDNVSEGGYTQSARDSVIKSDYTATLFEISNTNSLSFKPFTYYKLFKDTGLTYKNTIKFLRTEFIGDADNPEWDKLTVDWTDSDSITTHTLDFTLALSEQGDDFKQSFTVTATLPPQIDKYYGTLKLTFPYTVFTAETGFSHVSKTDSTWKKEQFKQSLSLSLFNSDLKFTESFNYELENDYADALKLSLSWKGLQAAYTMRYTNPYDFDNDTGWILNSNKKFLPYSASLAYANTTRSFSFWKNRITFSPGISTSLVLDMIRPTNSYFIFSPSITFKINEFLNITFSSTSKNSVLYRYVQGALGYPDRIPGEQNMFVDLMNSFRFDDEKLRQASGFKLQSLSMTITHDLHDWDLKSTFKIEPRFITENGVNRYDFSPYFTLSVVWRPMDSIKAEIVDDYGTWKLNPATD